MSAISWIWGLAGGLLIGVAMSGALRTEKPQGNVPAPFSEPLETAMVDTLTPNVIELHYLPKAEFDKQKPAPNVVGWAEPDKRPCRVYLPEGGHVYLDPKEGRARQIESSSDLIHEIMHCQRGLWHRDWTKAELGLEPEKKDASK